MTEPQTQTKPTATDTRGLGIAMIGAFVAAVGGVMAWVAHSRLAEASRVNGLTNAMLGWGGNRPSAAMQSATTMGHFGLGVLIFGLALLLCGVVVAAVKR